MASMKIQDLLAMDLAASRRYFDAKKSADRVLSPSWVQPASKFHIARLPEAILDENRKRKSGRLLSIGVEQKKVLYYREKLYLHSLQTRPTKFPLSFEYRQ